MAKSKSLLKVEGTLDGVTFYRKDGEAFAKMKSGVSKQRFATDPAFIRVRENANEFKIASNCTKMVCDPIRPFVKGSSDSKMNNRMRSLMHEFKKMDSTSTRGNRSPLVSLAIAEAKARLKGFEFNERAKLSSVLFNEIVVDSVAGKITIEALDAQNDISFDPSATHFSLMFCKVDIDLSTGKSKTAKSNVYTGCLTDVPTDVILQLSSTTPIGGLQIFVFKVAFAQETNGVVYPLKDGSYNACKIIEVL